MSDDDEDADDETFGDDDVLVADTVGVVPVVVRRASFRSELAADLSIEFFAEY